MKQDILRNHSNPDLQIEKSRTRGAISHHCQALSSHFDPWQILRPKSCHTGELTSQTRGRDLTEQVVKGRLLLSTSDSEVRRERLIYLAASIPTWAVTAFFVPVTVISVVKGTSLVNIFSATAFSTAFVVAGVYLVSLATNSQPLHLCETGVDNFRKGLRLGFRPLNDIECIGIDVGAGGATVRFWIRGRWRRICNTLSLTREGMRKEEIREAVEFLRAKGAKVDLTGSAKSWLG